jgi:uncharacterized protein YggE
MKKFTFACVMILLAAPVLCHGQISGNVGFGNPAGRARADSRDRAMRGLAEGERPTTATSSFLEVHVLMNVKADEYVAVFGIMHEGETLAECGKKMDATIKTFLAELKKVGSSDKDVYVDFITHNKIYGYQVQADFLQEKLVGFELKKNVAIRYTDSAQFDKIAQAAAKAEIFDLIKVDYIVKDIAGIQEKLMDEAARIAKNKMTRYEKLLGVRLQAPVQLYAEKSAVHYPTTMYDSYTAYEAEEVRLPETKTKKYTVRNLRKSSTFFFNPLNADGFDAVINPVIVEPVVQFTMHLKMKYDVEQPRVR